MLAPHPDDEVLGCGGTVIQKVRAGASVAIAFMTDGGRSHAAFLPRAELVRRRRGEALAATARLGVPPSAVTFLDFPDGELGDSMSAATGAIVDLVSELRPAQVLAPCPWDFTPDHVATRTAAEEALRRGGLGPLLLGYPVWFWDRWPWTSPDARPPASRAAVRAAVGHWRLARHFRASVDIADVLEQKKAALDCHRSQVSRPDDNPDWPVLAEVGGGTLLPLLLDEREAFTVTRVASRTG